MATTSKFTALEVASKIALLPTSADSGAQALASSVKFPSSGSFNAGDSIVVASTMPFHIVAGDGTVAATTSSPKFPAGVYKFVVPDGCTNVAMIDGSEGAGKGQAYLG